MRARIAGVLLAALALATPQIAFAWGSPGHRVTGYIANSLLHPATRAQLQALVGTDDLAQIATMLDDERELREQQRPGTSKWHYENRAACGPENTRACSNGLCITVQINVHLAILKDRSKPKADRQDAVRVLAHLIGDLHQPLHLADIGDRGGNDTYVLLPKERDARRLHEAWDTSFVKLNLRRRQPSTYAKALKNEFADQQGAWAGGSVEDWAKESYLLGQTTAYGSLPNFSCAAARGATPIMLTPEYVGAAQRVINEQLAKAGVRLASALNGALKE